MVTQTKHTPGPWYNPTNQQLSEEQLTAIREYAVQNGRNWKSKLNDDWFHARQAGPLQQIRNQFGPTWLKHFNLRAAIAAA